MGFFATPMMGIDECTATTHRVAMNACAETEMLDCIAMNACDGH
jgi:hypothetical protein